MRVVPSGNPLRSCSISCGLYYMMYVCVYYERCVIYIWHILWALCPLVAPGAVSKSLAYCVFRQHIRKNTHTHTHARTRMHTRTQRTRRRTLRLWAEGSVREQRGLFTAYPSLLESLDDEQGLDYAQSLIHELVAYPWLLYAYVCRMHAYIQTYICMCEVIFF